jgi:hypothetical protein
MGTEGRQKNNTFFNLPLEGVTLILSFPAGQARWTV